MTTFRIPMRHAAMAAALLLFAGCGAMTSAPVLDDSVRIDDNGAAPQASTMPIDTPADAGGGGTVTPDPGFPDTFDPTSRYSDMTSAQGGTVSNGRWKVVVSSGAFDGTARISISTQSAKSFQCDLKILPGDQNGFDAPVFLVADCHTVPTPQLAKWTIFELDTATGTWVPMESIVNTKKKTVTATLSHFSTYKVGLYRGPLTL